MFFISVHDSGTAMYPKKHRCIYTSIYNNTPSLKSKKNAQPWQVRWQSFETITILDLPSTPMAVTGGKWSLLLGSPRCENLKTVSLSIKPWFAHATKSAFAQKKHRTHGMWGKETKNAHKTWTSISRCVCVCAEWTISWHICSVNSKHIE